MEFIFILTKYNDKSFKPQVSKALEKRTELVSRTEHPQMWKCVDKMNLKAKASEEVLKKRHSRYKLYGILLLILGFFLLIPSLMEPREMLIPLLVSTFTIGIGILNFRYARKSKKVKLTSFDKAAIKLFSEYEKIPMVTVTFTNDKVQLVGNVTIGYSEIEKIFITEDLFILIWNKRIAVLQKKDLSSYNVEEFISFITYKSHNLFEIVNISE
ncbi:hypothetical protein CS063_04860 [Sporanaerobium hydrogeniformans]|uniref:Uncharacterized protein n=1 Tax=Sporanaerobium hydrogeniformans TaxID=3072179 RepID=A0AC61DF07_9FIRM|nr:YcxB family protein [Sporanaerobium hydrogeniformans]PHV71383.1 hypothetical protein CS063_04860 [Sporanaerobium hydrogeniformans]